MKKKRKNENIYIYRTIFLLSMSPLSRSRKSLLLYVYTKLYTTLSQTKRKIKEEEKKNLGKISINGESSPI